MAGIEIEAGEIKIEISKDDFAESMRNIEKLLKPGTPVMLEKQSFDSDRIGKRSEQTIFFSGGHLNEGGVFDIQKGKRNFSYIFFSKNNPDNYQIVHYWKELLDNNRIEVPHDWVTREFNEGTFSPAGPTEWGSFHNRGTKRIVIGDTVAKHFPDAIKALEFTRNAVCFELPDFYFVQSHLITETGDNTKEPGEQRGRQTNRMVRLNACIRLINEANRKIRQLDTPIIAVQIGYFRNVPQTFLKKYPVDKETYLIKEMLGQQENIAFIKIGRTMNSEVYILPFNEEMEQVIESAFSEERIKKYYP